MLVHVLVEISLIFANGYNAKIALVMIILGRRGSMVVGFTTTCAIGDYHH